MVNMVGVVWQFYQMNDGHMYQAGEDGTFSALPKHVPALMLAGCAYQGAAVGVPV
jgi:hypothetical protein